MKLFFQSPKRIAKPLPGWERCHAISRQPAAVEPDTAFPFPRGRARDRFRPGGVLLLTSFFFTFVGVGLAGVLNKFGFSLELVIGPSGEAFVPASRSAGSALAAVGGMLGMATAIGFTVSWTTEEQANRGRKLSWAFWSVCLVAMLLRLMADATIEWPGWEAFLAQERVEIPLTSMLLSMAIAGAAFLFGVGFHQALIPCKYDHGENDGPIGPHADLYRERRDWLFVCLCAVLLASMVGVLLLF